MLRLVGRDVAKWERYIITLETSHVRIKDEGDELNWGGDWS
jgi:hypothetical protein